MRKRKRQKVDFFDVRYPKVTQNRAPTIRDFERLYTEWKEFTHRRSGADFCDAEFREWFDSEDCWWNKDSYLPFREWYESNKKILESEAYQKYRAELEAQERDATDRFKNYDHIKYHYEVALGYIGRKLSILEAWYSDKEATVQLAEAFLLELAISEFVFLSETASVRESQEYKDWLVEDEKWDSFPHMRRRGTHNFTWQALKSDKDCHNGDRVRAEAVVSEVQARVRDTDCEPIHMQLEAEFARFSSSDLDFEYWRTSVISDKCSKDSLARSGFDDIEKLLADWDARGGISGWDEQAAEEREKTESLHKCFEDIFE